MAQPPLGKYAGVKRGEGDTAQTVQSVSPHEPGLGLSHSGAGGELEGVKQEPVQGGVSVWWKVRLERPLGNCAGVRDTTKTKK